MPKSKCSKRASKEQRRDMIRPIWTHIPASKVRNTWPKISETGQVEVLKVLEDASLPVVHAIKGDKRREEFQLILSKLLSKTKRKLGKVPVPPSTADIHYKYDSLVAQRDQLEAAMLPLLEQIPMLEAEIEKEIAELGQDKAYLQELEQRAASHERISNNSTKLAERLIKKYENEGSSIPDSALAINFEPHPSAPSTISHPELKAHVAKLTENTANLRPLLNSIEVISSVIGPSKELKSI